MPTDPRHLSAGKTAVEGGPSGFPSFNFNDCHTAFLFGKDQGVLTAHSALAQRVLDFIDFAEEG